MNPEVEVQKRRIVTVTINPLGFALQHYGANLEIVPFEHHALVGSAYMQTIPMWLVKDVVGRDDVNANKGASWGGEVGYRIYSGSHGADGVFAGVSFVSTPLFSARLAADDKSADLKRFNAPGAALDIGGQKVTKSGFTIGGGIGAMYLAYDVPSDVRRIPIPTPHVLPRVLLTAGWSF